MCGLLVKHASALVEAKPVLCVVPPLLLCPVTNVFNDMVQCSYSVPKYDIFAHFLVHIMCLTHLVRAPLWF